MTHLAISVAGSHLTMKPELAESAENAGFETVWNSGESVPIFASMLERTTRARVGSGVFRAFQFEPRNLAQHTADLQRVYGGRFVLGLGGGTKNWNISTLGRDFPHPASRIREMIRAIKLAWDTPSAQRLSFHGEFYDFEGSALDWNDNGTSPAAPIYLAAVNPGMLRLAGDLCAGLCGHPIASVGFIEDVLWPHIDEGLRRSGRTRADFDHQGWITFAISRDRQQALRELKLSIGPFLATRSYASVLDSQGYVDVRKQIQDAFFNHPGDFDALAEAIPDNVAAEHGICGTPDEVVEQAQRYDGVIDTLCLYSANASMSLERTHENLKLAIEAFRR
jgi:alkanesulfonate monooxygenase SsuD/methylene tetrahydromethanopterin reductase-like flavin-dependent oxidoreductase (luciferase family)